MIAKFITTIIFLCIVSSYLIFKLTMSSKKGSGNLQFIYFNIYFWFAYSVITILLLLNQYIYVFSSSIILFLLSLFFWIKYVNEHPTDFFKKYFWPVYTLCLLFMISTILSIKFSYNISKKEIPNGEDGRVGNRGEIGNGSKIGSDSEICYQHLMYHIDSIFDSWRSNRNQLVNTDNSGINNIYFKDNIRRICESTQFNKMVEDNFKYAPCPVTKKKGIDKCYHGQKRNSYSNEISTYHGLQPTIEYLKSVVGEWIYHILGNDRVLVSKRSPNIIKWVDPLTDLKYDVDENDGAVYLLEEPYDYLGNRKQCTSKSNVCLTSFGNNNEYIKVGWRKPNNQYGKLTPNGYKRGQYFLEDYSSTDYSWDSLLYKARPYYELDSPFDLIKSHPVWNWKKCGPNKKCP